MSDLAETAEKWADEMLDLTMGRWINGLVAIFEVVHQPPATHSPLPPRATQHQRQLVGLITNV